MALTDGFGNFSYGMDGDPMNVVALSPVPKIKRGMFGGGAGNFLANFVIGLSAANGNPAAAAFMQNQFATRQRAADRQQEQDDYRQRRQDALSDQMRLYQYKLDHPAPINNDTANDYNFYKSVLSPGQFQTWIANRINPPVLQNVPGVGLVQIPRQGAPSAPTAPVGQLTPYDGGAGPTAPRPFR